MPDARTPIQRIADIQRAGDPITAQQRYDATALLRDMHATAARHGITPADINAAVDLPAACLAAVRARAARS